MRQIGCRVAHRCTFEVDVAKILRNLWGDFEAFRFPEMANSILCENILQDFNEERLTLHDFGSDSKRIAESFIKLRSKLALRLEASGRSIPFRLVQNCAREVLGEIEWASRAIDPGSCSVWSEIGEAEDVGETLGYALAIKLWPETDPDSRKGALLKIGDDLLDLLHRWPRSERVRMVGAEVVNRKQFEILSRTKKRLPKYWRARRRVNHGYEFCLSCEANAVRSKKYCPTHSRRKPRFDLILEEIRRELTSKPSFKEKFKFLDPRVQYDAKELVDCGTGLTGRVERNLRFVASLIADKDPEQIENLLDLAYVQFEALSDDARSVKNLTELTEIYAQKRHALRKESLSKRLDLGGAFMTEAMSHHLRWWPLGPKRVQLFF